MLLQRKNKRKGIAVAAMGIMCAAAVFCGLFVPNNIQNTNAYTAANPAPGTSIGEITLNDYSTRTDGYVFNGTNMRALYGKLIKGQDPSSTAAPTLANATAAVTASTSTLVGRSTLTSTQHNSLDFGTMQTNLRG